MVESDSDHNWKNNFSPGMLFSQNHTENWYALFFWVKKYTTPMGWTFGKSQNSPFQQEFLGFF